MLMILVVIILGLMYYQNMGSNNEVAQPKPVAKSASHSKKPLRRPAKKKFKSNQVNKNNALNLENLMPKSGAAAWSEYGSDVLSLPNDDLLLASTQRDLVTSSISKKNVKSSHDLRPLPPIKKQKNIFFNCPANYFEESQDAVLSDRKIDIV